MLTEEQADVIKALSSGVPFVKVNAFAGTGKTTTLVEAAKSLADKKILYLAFNKSIQMEAKEKFPSNVTVKTTHSLAYSHFVIPGKYKKIRGEYRPREIAEFFHIPLDLANLVVFVFNKYCNGADKHIHVNQTYDDKDFTSATKYASKLFEMMLSKKIAITHSFYLKAFQLALLGGTVSIHPYDVVMLDEAQDTNDVTISIFEHLPARQKIIVGDRHQQIYSFRGSVNAMRKMNGMELYLTRSFRFKEEIASVASYFLSNFKGEMKRVKGSLIEGRAKEVAYISRTNAILIGKIAKLIERKKYFKTVREPYAIFGLALNILRLAEGNKKEFDSSYDFLEYFYKDFLSSSRHSDFIDFLMEQGIQAEDKELISAASLIKEHGSAIFSYYDVAKEYYAKEEETNIYLSTIHTAKGLEWDKVILLEDVDVLEDIAKHFAQNYQRKQRIDFMNEFKKDVLSEHVAQEIIDELNLYYVAITRAKFEIEDKNGLYEKLKKRDRNSINNRIFAKYLDRKELQS